MKKKVYSLLDEEQKLIYEETKDEKGNLLYYIDYQADPIAEKYFEYDEAGNMTSERDVEGGIETSKTETEYKDGKVVSIKLYISQELYEETKVEYNADGQVSTSYVYGEETDKVIYKNTDKGSEEIGYVNGEMEYKLVTIKDKLVKKVFIYNENEELEATEETTSNLYGEETLMQHFDTNRKLLNEYVCTYLKGLLVTAEYIDYMDAKNNSSEKFEYDQRNNLTQYEINYPYQYKVEFKHRKYDLNNRIIEESGITTGSEHIYMSHFVGVGFDLIHLYE